MPIQSFFWAAALVLTSSFCLAQPVTVTLDDPRTIEASLDVYLPAGMSYDPAIPKPSSVLGFEVGERHVRHDQLVAYMRELAHSSDRVELEVTGRTHEKRELLLLTISTPENLARRDQLRDAHLALSNPQQKRPDTSEMPVVVYLGYSIHGNEASGSNASLLVAYHLAAAQDASVKELLRNTIVLLDPSLNPDGLGRFAHWANTHRGEVAVADPEHREHREGWPNGRTNHYGFDLNRDWLPAQHPESQARLAQFHAWRPNVLADFHEMGTNSTYFFQPGIPRRNHPLTPKRNLELTREIAKFHARALDRVGSLYYSEETFDDFYYGKGSTYPDVNGAIGILFEQASVRGHLQESQDGIMNFPFAVRNHFLTSLSTLEGAHNHRQALLDYQADFYREAPPPGVAGWIFGSNDASRLHHFLELLHRHRITVHELERPTELDAQVFEPGSAYLALTDQPQHRLLQAIFEQRVDFADNTFYDISTWTMPFAFGLDFAPVKNAANARDLSGTTLSELTQPPGRFVPKSEAYAYLFDWKDFYAPRALHQLLRAGVRARVATTPLTVEDEGDKREYAAGTIVMPVGLQGLDRPNLEKLLKQVAETNALELRAVETGLTVEEADLGSPTLRPLELPQIALLVGDGISIYEAGEIWHLLDHRFGLPVTLLRVERLEKADLSRYTHLILVEGEYQRLQDKAVDSVRNWVRDGGVLIATKGAVPWADRKIFPDRLPLNKHDGHEPENRSKIDRTSPTHTGFAANEPKDDRLSTARRPYGEHEPDSALHLISGAIFEIELDLTHPLAFGYQGETLAAFRNSQIFLAAEENPYVTVAQYTASPLLSGYISEENLSQLRGTPALTAHRVDKGAIVRMVDNPSFRAFWYGTQKFLLNAVFFGHILDDTEE